MDSIYQFFTKTFGYIYFQEFFYLILEFWIRKNLHVSRCACVRLLSKKSQITNQILKKKRSSDDDKMTEIDIIAKLSNLC